jgi:hypothetical protein
MKTVLFFSLYLCFSLFSYHLHALEIDEKLTIRLLRLSSSKKTVLINRGEEDGLKEGDHAKFYLTSGIIARGVAVKVSPNRSVWSLYRVVMQEKLEEEVVLGLKITEPAKITEDPTKMITPDDAANVGDDVPEDLRVSTEDLRPLPRGVPVVNAPNDIKGASKNHGEVSHQRRFEMWGALQLNNLVAETTTGTDVTAEAAGKISFLDITLGGQLYFPPSVEEKKNTFLNHIAIGPVLHYSKQDFEVDGSSATITTTEFGVGGEYYIKAPFVTKTFLPFVEARIGLGQVATSNSDEDINGNSFFFNVGGGAKYFMSEQLSLRGSVDYYRRAETYEFDDIDSVEVTVSGFRLLLGVGIHF